jgi:cytochrome c-type biogenesis protein CcmH/NrfF
MKIVPTVIAIFFVINVSASDLSERRVHIKKMETKFSMASAERKASSEAVLQKNNVPINESLPYIEDESEALVRSKGEIAERAMALIVVAVKAEGLEQEIVDQLVEGYGLKNVLSPKEMEFISEKSSSYHDKTQFIWRYEAAWVLLWVLGYVDELSYPNEICSVTAAVAALHERTKEQFVADADLRSISEILDEADLIYRYHWAVVDARIKGQPAPSALDPSVVLERHYTLNWLIGYMGQEWDDISTDT